MTLLLGVVQTVTGSPFAGELAVLHGIVVFVGDQWV